MKIKLTLFEYCFISANNIAKEKCELIPHRKIYRVTNRKILDQLLFQNQIFKMSGWPIDDYFQTSFLKFNKAKSGKYNFQPKTIAYNSVRLVLIDNTSHQLYPIRSEFFDVQLHSNEPIRINLDKLIGIANLPPLQDFDLYTYAKSYGVDINVYELSEYRNSRGKILAAGILSSNAPGNISLLYNMLCNALRNYLLRYFGH